MTRQTKEETTIENEQPQPAIIIDDDVWEQLIDLTDGAAALCYQCGTCTAACPWGQFTNLDFSVRTFLRQAQIGVFQASEDLWLCTTCAQCQPLCPRGVNIVDVFRAIRTLAWQNRTVAEGLPSILWSLYWNDNPWSQPPSQRSAWAGDIAIPQFNAQKHEILLYVGCTSSYDSRAQQIALALVQILRAAGIRFGYLGNLEPCCGEAVLNLGNRPYFEEIRAKTAAVFTQHGVTDLVVISPHCYDVFKNHYNTISKSIQVQHYTQYLTRLLEEGRLRFSRSINKQVTYQDPCYLGRHNAEYAAARTIIDHLPGVEFREMGRNREDGLCCGGGGGRMWLETPAGERFADHRVKEALETKAQILATACPFCAVCLEDSAKNLGQTELEIMDIAELARLGIE